MCFTLKAILFSLLIQLVQIYQNKDQEKNPFDFSFIVSRVGFMYSCFFLLNIFYTYHSCSNKMKIMWLVLFFSIVLCCAWAVFVKRPKLNGQKHIQLSIPLIHIKMKWNINYNFRIQKIWSSVNDDLTCRSSLSTFSLEEGMFWRLQFSYNKNWIIVENSFPV